MLFIKTIIELSLPTMSEMSQQGKKRVRGIVIFNFN